MLSSTSKEDPETRYRSYIHVTCHTYTLQVIHTRYRSYIHVTGHTYTLQVIHTRYRSYMHQKCILCTRLYSSFFSMFQALPLVRTSLANLHYSPYKRSLYKGRIPLSDICGLRRSVDFVSLVSHKGGTL
jgi:hypothetical protein